MLLWMLGLLGLHGFTAVAELKAPLVWLCHEKQMASPRLHRRGRIEGRSSRFPRTSSSRSPRLHRRGRIEGGFFGLRDGWRYRGLHGFTAVAELKDGLHRGHGDSGFGSPRLHRRGRIEGLLALPTDDEPVEVSTASPPWPN